MFNKRKECFYCQKEINELEEIDSAIHTECESRYQADMQDDKIALTYLEEKFGMTFGVFFRDWGDDDDEWPVNYVVLNSITGLVERLCLFGDSNHEAGLNVNYDDIFNKLTLFKQAKYLSLDCFDKFQSFPEEFSKMPKLEAISLSNVKFDDTNGPYICNIKNLLMINVGNIDSILNHMGEHLTYLCIINNLGYFPNKICNFTDLEILKVKTGCNSIPEEIRVLKNLKKLDLQSNELTSLPDSIQHLTNLKYINLDYNRLTDISILEKLKNLRYISVGGYHRDFNLNPGAHYTPKNERNQLTTLPSFKNLPFLRILMLYLSDTCTFAELYKIGECSQLTFLRIDSDVVEYPENFKSLQQLKKLIYRSNKNLTPSFVKYLKKLKKIFLLSDFKEIEPIRLDELEEEEIDYEIDDTENGMKFYGNL